MREFLKKCMICPRECKVNRLNNELGFCKSNDKIKIAKYSLHMWEEPCISGKNGSGTIFFSYCNLKCVYCQNYDISTNNYGREITIQRLSEIMLELQDKKANNINLVTPTHYVPQIIEAIKLAKRKGLSIPIVYNTSGYEKKETIKLLNGYVDIYLTDFKYYDNEIAVKYSKAYNYKEYAKESLKEMVKQTGKPKFNGDLMVSGVIVRNLLLPGMVDDSKKILNYLYNTYKDNIFISIMNQYTPLKYVSKYKELNRIVTNMEYDKIVNYAIDIGISNAFIQEGETQKESFIPSFSNDEI